MGIGLGMNVDGARAARRLGEASHTLGKQLSRLSTGQRINTAGDDAAGLAISEDLKTKRRLHLQAIRNISDGLSALSIMDAAIASQIDVTSRLQELAEQAANGTYSQRQRDALNTEYQTLVAEMQRLADAVQFNNLPLLRGGVLESSSSFNVQTGVSGSATAAIPISLTNTGSLSGWVDFTRLGGDIRHDGAIDLSDLFEMDSDFICQHKEFGDNLTIDQIAEYMGGTFSGLPLSQVPIYTARVVDSNGQARDLALVLTYTFLGGTGSGETPPNELGLFVYEKNAAGTYDHSAVAGAGYLDIALSVDQQTKQISSTVDVSLAGGGSVTIDLRGLALRNGATAGSMTALEFSGVETLTRAWDALSITEAWGESLSAVRAQVGATQSRLQSSLAVNEVIQENVAQARARITDADIASEVAGSVAARVRQEAAAAVLAQANGASRIVLDLIG